MIASIITLPYDHPFCPLQICICMYIYIYTYIHTLTCICICIFVCVYIMTVSTHSQTRTHAHTYTFTVGKSNIPFTDIYNFSYACIHIYTKYTSDIDDIENVALTHTDNVLTSMHAYTHICIHGVYSRIDDMENLALAHTDNVFMNIFIYTHTH